VVVACEILYYATSISDILKTVKRILKDNGVFILVSALRNASQSKIIRAAADNCLSVEFFDINLAKAEIESSADVAGYNLFLAFQHDTTGVLAIQQLLQADRFNRWRIRKEDILKEEISNEDDSNMFSQFNLFSSS